MKPELAIRYFHSFSMKDIATIDILLADNVVMKDWHGMHEGKEIVLEYLDNLFKIPNSALFELDICRVAVGQDTVIAEVILIINKKPIFSMVNVLDYDEDNKIKAIRAYRR